MARGRFISFEGGEGCGKSTQIKLLSERLRECGIPVIATREPGGTPLGEKIRSLLKEYYENPPCSRAEVLLFLAARAQLVDNLIKPQLERGVWVLSDRFCDSTFAYQGYGRGLDLEILRVANAFACDGLMPEKTFLLELDEASALRRIRKREQDTKTSSDRIEKAGEEFHLKLKRGFDELARQSPGRFVRIDAGGTVEEVGSEIWNSIKHLT